MNTSKREENMKFKVIFRVLVAFNLVLSAWMCLYPKTSFLSCYTILVMNCHGEPVEPSY